AGEPEHGDRGATRRLAWHRAGDSGKDRRLSNRTRSLPLRRGTRRDLRHRPRQARPAAGAGRPVKEAIERLPAPHAILAAACCGVAAANVARIHGFALAGLAVSSLVAVLLVPESRLLVAVLVALLAGWWWGSARLDAIDRSPLSRLLGTAERALVVVT